MNKKIEKRLNTLLPGGVPKYVRCYDNGGKTADRYIAVYTGNYRIRGLKRGERVNTNYLHVCMSEYPFHPQGVGLHGESPSQIDTNSFGFAPMIGKRNHLGRRIAFTDLPPDCQRLVLSDYREIWGLPKSP